MMCLLHLFAVAHPGAIRSSFKEKRPTWVAKDFSLSWMNASIEPTPPSLERGHDTQNSGIFRMGSPKRTKISKKNGGGFGATTHFWTFFVYHQSVKMGGFPSLLARLLVKIPFGQFPHLLCFLPRKLDHQLTNPEKKKHRNLRFFLSAQWKHPKKSSECAIKSQVKTVKTLHKKSWKTLPRDFKGKPSGNGRSPAFAVAPKAWSNGTPVSPASPAIDRMATESQASTTWRRFLDFWISGCVVPKSSTPKKKNVILLKTAQNDSRGP